MKQKILAFCLRHWKEIGLVLLLLIVFGKSQYDMRNAIKAHEVSEQSLKTQIETLQTLHAKELKKRDEAVIQYRKDIEKLEQDYEERQTEIVYLTKARKKVIIKEFSENKNLIIERFIQTYGLQYVD